MGYARFTHEKIAPFYQVSVDGFALGAALQRRIESVQIEHRQNKAMTARVVIRDETLEFVDLEIWGKGAKWIVHLGFKEDFRPFGPFKVLDYTMDFNEAGHCVITVTLMDRCRDLMQTCKWRSWNAATIGDVVQKIAEEHGLGYDIEDGGKFTFSDELALMQAGVSDALLLQQLAERFGYRFEIRNGNIVFKQRQTNDDVEEKKLLAWRINPRSLMSFVPAQVSFGGDGKQAGTVGQAGAKQCVCNYDIKKGTAFDIHVDTSGSDGALAQLTGGSDEEQQGGDVTASQDTLDAGHEDVSDPADDAIELTGVNDAMQDLFDTVDEVLVPKKDGDTPQTEEEAKDMAAASRAGTKSDPALATAVLTVADVYVEKGDRVDVIGVGKRFSGEWRIAEWLHVCSKDALQTTLYLGKKGLGAAPDTSAAEDKAAENDAANRNGEPEDSRTVKVGVNDDIQELFEVVRRKE